MRQVPDVANATAGESTAISFPGQLVTWEGECKDARCGKLQKEMCVNSFVNIFVSLVRKVANVFFKKSTSMTLIVTH
jgi:hypothetical protein